jgi:hypothetical protein
MQIKYFWPVRGGDPKEVCDITLEQEAVPRIGELVDIDVDIGGGEIVHKMGRVKDVTWYVRSEGYVTVFLDA